MIRRHRWHDLALGCWLSGVTFFGVVDGAWAQEQAQGQIVRTLPSQAPAAADTAAAKVLPINLDTVLRLAEDQNAQVGGARARVDEAFAAKSLADKAWLPAVNIGPTYYRHEGGIANEDGTLTHSSFSTLFAGVEINSRLDLREAVYQRINAERNLLQNQGELRRISTEALVEAAGTYIDLLAARTGEAIAVSLQKDLENLLQRAEKAADPVTGEPGARVVVAGIRAQVKSRQQAILELRDQAAGASAKLVYLLALDPCATLMPADERLVPLELVDATPPVCDLVSEALANGPGVREMEALLSLAQDANTKAKGPGRYIPVFDVGVAEGGFGTGPGDRQDWDNRFDMTLRARWNLTDLFTARDRQRVLNAKTAQAHFAHQDLQGKLAAGVQEARETILTGHEQIRLGQEQIDQAREAYRLSDQRLRSNVQGASYTEVLMNLQSVGSAQSGYVHALRSYDRAQLRLLVLLGRIGQNGESNCGHHHGPAKCR